MSLQYRVCKKCRHENLQAARFCAECGANLTRFDLRAFTKALVLTALPLVITPVVLFSSIDPDEDAMAFGALSVLAFLFIILLMVGCFIFAAIAVVGAVRRGRNRSALAILFGFGVGLMLGVASCNASLDAWVRAAPESTPAQTPIPTVTRLPTAAPTPAPTQAPIQAPTPTLAPTQTPFLEPTAAPSPVPTPTGKSDAPGPPPPEDALLWKFSTGRPDELVMSHTLSQGRIYAASPRGQVYAVDAETGALLWSVDVSTELHSPPVPAGEAVYIEVQRGDFFALDPDTGERLPRDDEIGRVRGAAVRDGTAHITSVLRDGRIRVRALDAETGDLLWQTSPSAKLRGRGDGTGDPATPAVDALTFQVTVLGEGIYITDDTRIHAFDVGTGSLLWSFDARYRIELPPTAWDGKVYVRSSHGAHALDEATGEHLWEFEGEYGGPTDGTAYIAGGVWPLNLSTAEGVGVRSLNAATGETIWSLQGAVALLLADGTVFMISFNPVGSHARDAVTGEEIWSLDPAWGLIYNTTLADGVLYAESSESEGYLHAFNARTGEPIWSIDIGYQQPNGRTYAVSGGVLYVGYQDGGVDSGVYAYAAP